MFENVILHVILICHELKSVQHNQTPNDSNHDFTYCDTLVALKHLCKTISYF